jgi:signal transduction histidine kinase
MNQHRFTPKRRENPADVARSLHAAKVLRANKESILREWEEIVRARIPAARDEERAVLRDHLPEFIDELVRALDPSVDKTLACADNDVCERHGEQRHDFTQFNIEQILSEYCVLQNLILESLRSQCDLSDHEVDVIIQSVNQGMREAVTAYTEQAASVQSDLTQELMRSNSELSRFAGIAAHDLKAPMNSISQFLELIHEDIRDRRFSDIDEYIGFVSAAANRMRALIDNLLIYARVGGTRESNFETIDLNEVASTVTASLKGVIDFTAAKVTWSSLPKLKGVRFELEQLFQNLVGNALKFKSAEVPEVRISCHHEGEFFHFIVADNGIGISPADLEKIFEPFRRSATSVRHEGSGLGLAICERIAVHHGGKIWVESEIGKGSAFHFTLPQAE